MKNIRKAIMYSALSQYSMHIMSFATIIVLARIMTPEEIGVYAVAGSVSLLAIELRSLGVVQFLIREKDLTEEKIRAALGVTVAVSWGLGAIIVLVAPFAGDFYGEIAIRNILWIMSSTFIIGPFTSVPLALWKRNMQFKPIFIQTLLGIGLGSVSSIILVLLGFSYYGLALGITIGLIVELIVAIYLQPAGTVWMPAMSWMGNLIKFGLYTSSSNLFIRFSEAIPDLVIGRLATMTDVGIFSRGLGVILFMNRIIVSAVAPVVLPHLSEVHREGKSVAEAYLRAIKLLVVFSWPIFAVVSVATYPMIRALFGDQWDAAVPLASILAFWAMLTSVHSFAASALIVTGNERFMFASGLLVFIFRLGGVIVAAPYGLEVIAWAIVASGMIELFINTWFIKKATGLSVRVFAVDFIPNIFIAFMCWLVVTLIDQIMPFDETSPWLSLAVIAVCLSATWVLLLRITKHEAWDIVVEIFNRIMPGIPKLYR